MKKTRGKLGCELYFWLLILAVGGGFYYAMRTWKTSPQETLKRLVTSAQNYFSPEPTPLPDEEIVLDEGTPPPRPRKPPKPSFVKQDRLQWLIEQKKYWPKQVTLKQPVEFPAVSAGKAVGSLVVPAGTAVKVIEITKDKVTAEHLGGRAQVALAATDLATMADSAFVQAQIDAEGSGAGAVAGPEEFIEQVEEDQAEIRDATRDELTKGLGAIYTRPATTFRIFAPNARGVSVVLYSDAGGERGRAVRPLRQQLNGLWDLTLRGDLRGKFYNFILNPNEAAREVLDPYATNAVASSSRGRITALTTPVPPGPKLESPVDAVIYEMHVRDFTVSPNSGVKKAGLYRGWTEEGTTLPGDAAIKTALDNLTELGVTHVQLMPPQDFENNEAQRNYNWGYITSAFFSPEGMFASNPDDFSRVRELKALVKALHNRGIGVVMDVVYNHTSGKCSLFDIAPEYYFRRGSDGRLANGSGCGNEVKSESPMTRRLILDSLKYWVKEFGIDGFRFDLMALLDQETMRQAERELRAINPNIMIYGEPWMAGSTPLTSKTDKGALHQVQVGAFNDDFRNALKGQPDGNEPGWIQNGTKRDALKAAMMVSDWFAQPTQSINYMTCHDNLVLWDKLAQSMPGASDALRTETMKLGYLALFTAQGVPFMHGGEEFARTKGGNHNSYAAPDSINQVDWSLKKTNLDLFNYTRDVIALRKAHPMFRLRTRNDVRARVQIRDTPERNILMFTVNGEGVPGETWRRACVILNSADTADIDVNVPPGDWRLAFDATGATAAPQVVSGKINVRYKSGLVLFQ